MTNFIFKILIICITTTISIDCCAQNGPPPPMAKPKNENKPLIDEIIEVSKYDQYFRNYCINHIYTTAKNKNWTKEKTTEVLNKVNLDHFKFTIYNLFAKHSTEQLSALIVEYRTKENVITQNIIVESKMVSENLKSYAKNLVGGYEKN